MHAAFTRFEVKVKKWKEWDSYFFFFFVFTLTVLNLDNKLIVLALLLHSSCETAMGDLKWTQHKARYCQQQIFSRRQGWNLMLRRTKDLCQRLVESYYTYFKYKTLISEVRWASNWSLVEGSQRLATPLDNQELLPGTDLRPRLHSSWHRDRLQLCLERFRCLSFQSNAWTRIHNPL